MRKPKSIKTDNIYAGVEIKRNDTMWGFLVYVGGPSSGEHTHIHITEKSDIKRLINWLTKVDKYLENK